MAADLNDSAELMAELKDDINMDQTSVDETGTAETAAPTAVAEKPAGPKTGMST